MIVADNYIWCHRVCNCSEKLYFLRDYYVRLLKLQNVEDRKLGDFRVLLQSVQDRRGFSPLAYLKVTNSRQKKEMVNAKV